MVNGQEEKGMESDHNRVVKNPGNDLQEENIDIALNWEHGVFKQIMTLNLFKKIKKRKTYEKHIKHNYKEKKLHQHNDT